MTLTKETLKQESINLSNYFKEKLIEPEDAQEIMDNLSLTISLVSIQTLFDRTKEKR